MHWIYKVVAQLVDSNYYLLLSLRVINLTGHCIYKVVALPVDSNYSLLSLQMINFAVSTGFIKW